MCSPSAGAGPSGLEAELGGGLLDRPDRAGADVLAVEELEPLGERARGDRLGEPGRDRLLVRVELALRELRPARDLAQPLPELRLERADRQPAPVGGRVDPVAGERRRSAAARAGRSSRCATSRCEPWVIETTIRAPRPVRSRSSSAAVTSSAAERPPAARSAICVGGMAGAVSASTPAQPR